MAFSLTIAQKNELQALYNSFPETTSSSWSQNLNYYTMYEKVLSYIDAYEVQGNILDLEEKKFKIWLKGVIDVNKGVGSQSDFIREYNSVQNELRYGESITQAELDKASDKIALLVIGDILASGQLRTIAQAAGEDVATVSQDLLNDDKAAWAGNPLLLALGYDDAFNANIINASDPTYEILSVMKITAEIASTMAVPIPVPTLLAAFNWDFFSLIYNGINTSIQAEATQTLQNAYNAA